MTKRDEALAEIGEAAKVKAQAQRAFVSALRRGRRVKLSVREMARAAGLSKSRIDQLIR